MNPTIHHGDCLDALRQMPDNSVHAIVTDPPYGLSNTSPDQVADTIVRWVNGERDYLPSGKGFMGKAWDGFVPPVAVWDEAMRVLKPGGHVLAFAGTRTHDLMTLGLRLAGFDIRDSLAWLYGSGFPKSMDVSKAIDKAAGAERPVIGANPRAAQQTPKRDATALGKFNGTPAGLTGPATPAAEQWQGWGTALKPATEPIVWARKPFKGTVAANVLEHGTGAINVDACRIGTNEDLRRPFGAPSDHVGQLRNLPRGELNTGSDKGRWPANVILDEHMARALDQQSGNLPTQKTRNNPARASDGEMFGLTAGGERSNPGAGEQGGASRFFHVIEQDAPFIYCAKAPKKERPQVEGVAHSTVKPLKLMRLLVRMVTPPGGTVLEPFAGSGTTIEAAMLEGFDCIGIEREAEYLPLIHERIRRATEQLRTEQEAQAEAPEQGALPLEGIA